MLTDRLREWLADPGPPEQFDLPEIEAPPLHDLKVRVPYPGDMTEEALLTLYNDLLLEHVPRRSRETGEFAQNGDEARVCMAAFVDGHAVPFSVQDEVVLTVGEPWVLPGVGEQLEGCTLDELIEMPVVFPENWPVPSLQGREGVYRMRVLGIEQLDMPDIDSPDLLDTLGIDGTIEELMAALEEDWVEDTKNAVIVEGHHLVLDLLRGRSPVEIPRRLVEQETWTRWASQEGRILLALEASEADLASSFAAWLRSPDVAGEVERRVHISLLLGAIAKRDEVELTEERVRGVLGDLADAFGIDLVAMEADLRADKRQAESVVQDAVHLLVVQHVMDHAKVKYRSV